MSGTPAARARLRIPGAGVPRDEDHGNERVEGAQPAGDIKAVEAGHDLVEKHAARLRTGERRQQILAIREGLDPVAPALEEEARRVQRRRIVVDDDEERSGSILGHGACEVERISKGVATASSARDRAAH